MKTARQNALHKAMQRPLIMGASVSADYLTHSPGKRLALRYTTADQVKVIARRGTRGRDILKSVSANHLKDRTCIICIDTFFWDSLTAQPAESLRALETVVAHAEQHRIPLVLAEIPEFMASIQVSVEALNSKIADLATRYAHCRILPLNRIMRETFERGYIEQDGRQISLEQLVPDGLHIAEPASEFLANEIAALFDEAFA